MEKRRSRTHQEGGKKPRWSDVFYLNVSAGNTMTVSVYDEDVVSDDFIGSAMVDVKKYLSQQGVQQCTNLLYCRNHPPTVQGKEQWYYYALN